MSQLIMQYADAQMQNVYTPLPFSAHLVFCIIATAVYCTQYYRKNSAHYLLLALAVDGTFLTQMNTDSIFITLLGIVELALLIAAGVFAFKYSKEQKAKEAAQKAEQEADEDSAQEKNEHTPPVQKKENAVDSAFDD